MDATTEQLAHYTTMLRYDALTPAALHAAKRVVIDAVGCAIGGYDGEPAVIARRLAQSSSGVPAARMIGSGIRTSMEAATFANSVMLRYLDYNDTYVSKGEGHPSDALAAVLAVADAYRRDGRAALLALAVAYEVYCALADAVSLRDKGWDHGYFVVFAAACGAGKLLGLDLRQMGNAIAIASAPNVPARQTRSGQLSMWKGCACAAAARAGVFAALLAKDGMTGPTAAFEGRHGVFDQVTRPFTLDTLGAHPRGSGLERTGIKQFPTEYHSQIPLALALGLGKNLRPDDIEAVHVQTYHLAWSEIGSEPEKWDPQTRETADHSLPYMLAAALRDGTISVNTFEEGRIRDPALRPLMRRILVSENAEYTRDFPRFMRNRIEITTRDGRTHADEGRYPRGHVENPMSDAELEAKFRALCNGRLGAAQCDRTLDTIWRLDAAADLDRLFELVRLDTTTTH